MKFKQFLKLYEAEKKSQEPKKKVTSKVKKEEKSEEEKELEQIILLRIELKDAKSDKQAQSIQDKINAILSKQKENKITVKDTQDEINKDSKSSKPSKEKEPR